MLEIVSVASQSLKFQSAREESEGSKVWGPEGWELEPRSCLLSEEFSKYSQTPHDAFDLWNIQLSPQIGLILQ